MNIDKIDYNKVDALSSKDLDYINKASYLRPFYLYENDINTFKRVINARQKYSTDRKLLVEALKKQYSNIQASQKTHDNTSSLLDEKTFTIITAHQPSLFGGPLYYMFKIASTIHLTQKLKAAYPDHHFVPVFINGSEDHDFEEVNHFHLYGKTVTWDVPHRGPVGRKSLDGIQEVIDQTREILGESPHSLHILEVYNQALAVANTYNDFVQHVVNALFGKYGLVIAQMDDPQLKRAFLPIMEEEIFEQTSHDYIENTQEELYKNGFKPQAHARKINLFYLNHEGRNRIIETDNGFEAKDTETSWTKEELKQELHDHPENFSPNVIMRPLYQELIFPNLAYIGGGGEIAYWLERKSQFEHFGIPFPMLLRRNSATIIDKSTTKKADQLGIGLKQVFQPQHILISEYLDRNSDADIHLDSEKAEIQKLWEKIASKASEVDPTLKKATLAQMTNQLKTIDSIESRMKRKLKSDEEINVNRIKKLKSLLFPNNGLQERHDNFMQYYAKHGEELIDYLVEQLDPLDSHYYLITL